jgi:hypothetical protein
MAIVCIHFAWSGVDAMIGFYWIFIYICIQFLCIISKDELVFQQWLRVSGKEQYPQKSTDLWKVPGNLYYKYTTDYKWRSIHRNPLICTRHWQYITNTVKPAGVDAMIGFYWIFIYIWIQFLCIISKDELVFQQWLRVSPFGQRKSGIIRQVTS